MNDWVGFLDGYDGQEYTPHMDRLAARGINFTNAHCPSAVCNPSRTAVMTGRMPSSTGIYRNDQWWRPNLPDVKTIPMAFKENGYKVVGAGKIYHHTAGFNPPDQWHDFQRQVFDDPWSHAGYYPELSGEYPDWFPNNGLTGDNEPANPSAFDWKGFDKSDYDMGDGKAAKYGIDFLKLLHEQPFFLAVGIYRPHIPWYFPAKYLRHYPIEDVEIPEITSDDLNDVPAIGQQFAAHRRSDLEIIQRFGKQPDAIQAYLASVSYADQLIGDLLSALDQSEYAENTIIVLWSDHGWHHGEKKHLHKGTLWERATRVPFILAGPGIPKAQINEAVNLVDIYPTLVEYCRLTNNQQLDGESLVSFFADPQHYREKPAITTYFRGNHAVRDEQYRYIRYKDGGEELYDHYVDPHEWNNLADDPDYKLVIERLHRWLPQQEKEGARRKGASKFDRVSYDWELKNAGL
jgi:arylsulfatase A-like enzyme